MCLMELPIRRSFTAVMPHLAKRFLYMGPSGGVGIAGVQLGRAAGMTVIGTASTERGRQLVSEQGARHVLDHSAASYLEEVKTLTDGRGVDVILEMLANVNLAKDIDLLAMRGRVVVIGNRGREESRRNRDQSTCGHDAGRLHHWHDLTQRHAQDHVRIHSALVAGLENGTLRPVIGQELPLAEAAQAHRARKRDRQSLR